MIRPHFVSYLSRSTSIFFRSESSAGVVMILFALFAVVAANSPFSELYLNFIESSVSFSWGKYDFALPFAEFVKEVLMVFFFFNVGMELKKEMVAGFLSEFSQVVSPLIAAFFGILFPALIYLAFNWFDATALHGWAIPCATDVAFALCVLALAGKGVNPTVKVFLLAIAVFDDLGAIIIIALFYGSELVLSPLGVSGIVVMLMIILNRLQVSSFFFYGILGIVLLACFQLGGISTSIAGVVTGLLIPYRCVLSDHKTVYPINENIRLFKPWVNFLILPLFAFSEAGVDFRGLTAGDFTSPVALGIALGLFFGKQIGIFGSTIVLIRMGWCKFPKTVKKHHIYGVALLSGIGFTMSLFVSKLAFTSPQLLDMAKVGIIMSAVASSVCGLAILRFWKRKPIRPKVS